MVFLLFIFSSWGMSQNDSIIEFKVSFEHWEQCEVGGNCPTLVVKRKNIKDSVVFIMPCGGSYTTVELHNNDAIGNGVIQKINIGFLECPPIFDLTNLPDGNYVASMFACGLGGSVSFVLVTEE